MISSANLQNHYKVLQISENASQTEIRKAYKQLAIKFHPDKNPNNRKKAEEEFKKISGAYEVLSDSVKKYDFDKTLKQFPSQTFTNDESEKVYHSSAMSELLKKAATEATRLFINENSAHLEQFYILQCAFNICIQNDSVDLLKALILHESNLIQLDPMIDRALNYFVKKHSHELEIIDLLCKNHANIFFTDHKYSAFDMRTSAFDHANQRGLTDIIKIFILNKSILHSSDHKNLIKNFHDKTKEVLITLAKSGDASKYYMQFFDVFFQDRGFFLDFCKTYIEHAKSGSAIIQFFRWYKAGDYCSALKMKFFINEDITGQRAIPSLLDKAKRKIMMLAREDKNLEFDPAVYKFLQSSTSIKYGFINFFHLDDSGAAYYKLCKKTAGNQRYNKSF